MKLFLISGKTYEDVSGKLVKVTYEYLGCMYCFKGDNGMHYDECGMVRDAFCKTSEHTLVKEIV